MWTQIRVLLQEQSDLGLECLTKKLLKHFSRQQKQMTFDVIGTFRVHLTKHMRYKIQLVNSSINVIKFEQVSTIRYKLACAYNKESNQISLCICTV